jgi:GntR family transcriptional regulator, transcriptional repressor for pyruvate dehydrogenase complex
VRADKSRTTILATERSQEAMPDASSLAPIRRTNLPDEIVGRIVDLILNQSLQPGDKLPSERELIEKLAVGRSSLREAISILSATGLVRVSIGEGMFVGDGDFSRIMRPMTLGFLMRGQSLTEMLEARRVIEVELAGLAALRGAKREVAEIARRLKIIPLLLDKPVEYGKADLEFHLAVGRAAHNQVLLNVLDSLRRMVQDSIRKHIATKPIDASVAYETHARIYDAIKRKDPNEARQAMSDHLARLENEVRAAT